MFTASHRATLLNKGPRFKASCCFPLAKMSAWRAKVSWKSRKTKRVETHQCRWWSTASRSAARTRPPPPWPGRSPPSGCWCSPSPEPEPDARHGRMPTGRPEWPLEGERKRRDEEPTCLQTTPLQRFERTRTWSAAAGYLWLWVVKAELCCFSVFWTFLQCLFRSVTQQHQSDYSAEQPMGIYGRFHPLTGASSWQTFFYHRRRRHNLII